MIVVEYSTLSMMYKATCKDHPGLVGLGNWHSKAIDDLVRKIAQRNQDDTVDEVRR